MSVNFEGSFDAFAGVNMPTPYIRRITAEDDGLTITLSLYLKIGKSDPESVTNQMIEQLSKKINTHVYITVRNERLDSIINGEKNIIEYVEQEQQTYLLEHIGASSTPIDNTLDPTDLYVTVDDIFSTTVDTDGNISYDNLVNKDVKSDDGSVSTDEFIWEFRVDKSISNKSGTTAGAEMDTSYIEGIFNNYLLQNYYILQMVESTPRNYSYTVSPDSLSEYVETLSTMYDMTSISIAASALDQASEEYFYNQVMDSGLNVCAFTTTIDLSDDEEIDFVLKNKYLLSTKISNVSYEKVFESFLPAFDGANREIFSEQWERMPLLGQTEIAQITTSDQLYRGVPLRSIGQTSHESHNRAEIISEFDSLILNTTTENRAQVQYMVDQINNVLTKYGTTAELLPQLNDLRAFFPSKNSSTAVGKLYGQFKKKLYSANRKVKSAPTLRQQLIRNPKFRDGRTKPVETWDSNPAAMEDVTNFADEFIYPDWYISREYNDQKDVYVQYGYFFFDYEKALRRASAIAQIYDISKLNEFGIDIRYKNFYIEEASIWRMVPDDPSSVCAKITSYFNTDNPAYPKTTNVRAENFTADTNNLQRLTSATADYGAVSSTDGTFGTNTSTGAFNISPSLFVRALSRKTGTPTMANYERLDNYLPSDYRLMLFEFQDIYALPMDDLEYEYYNTSFSVIDTTLGIVETISDAYNEHLENLNTYYEAANSWCSFNSITGEFNDFFMEAMQQLYEGTEETAPWNTAATAYTLYRDLIYDSYDGDRDKMSEAITAIIEGINPTTGNLESLQKFYQEMSDFYDYIWGPSSDTSSGGIVTQKISDLSLSDSMTITFESSADLGEANPPSSYWPTAWATVPECNSDDDDYGQSDCDEMYPDNVGEYRCSSLNKCYEIASGGSDDTTGSGDSDDGGSGGSGASAPSGGSGGSSKSGSTAEGATAPTAEDGPDASTYGAGGF